MPRELRQSEKFKNRFPSRIPIILGRIEAKLSKRMGTPASRSREKAFFKSKPRKPPLADNVDKTSEARHTPPPDNRSPA